MLTKKKRTRKYPKGVLSSGVVFVGDASYFAQPKETNDRFPNPLEDVDYTTESVSKGDFNLNFPNGIPGRGVLIQTHMTDGSYIVKKKKDKVTGKVKSITIEFK